LAKIRERWDSATTPWAIVGGVVLALLFVALYIRSRAQFIEFTAPGTVIKVHSSGRSLYEVRGLIETVESAKNAR